MSFVIATATLSPAGVATDLPLDVDPSMPERIGRYRILGRLGEGATSDVFLADDDFHGRRVAIKRVLPAGWGDAAERHYRGHFFAAEAALVGRLKHPNVVQLYDAVADADRPYLVMEHVPGCTLKRFCRPDALLPLAQVAQIGFKCAMALDYVARHGLVHRDVKPANLLAVVRDEPGGGVQVLDVKIGDFGSAFDHTSDRTQVYRVGSLAYMSPEQLDGSNLDARADQYALAAVLYHLVAGRPPFDAQTQAALMHQICHAEPPALTTLRGDVPEALDQLLRRALAKRPQDRFEDWTSFASELSALAQSGALGGARAHEVQHSERFELLRALEFFADFGDVELWEVVHRAQWLRHAFGQALYRAGEEGSTFHILARGRIEVFRDGERVASLGPGTSVGEMAYLAPSPDLRIHSADVVVAEPATTIAFTPQSLATLNPSTRHLFDQAFIKVLVRRLHAAHEALAHPRRIL